MRYRDLFDAADRCGAPKEDAEQVYVGWGEEAFQTADGWIVVIFYDGFSIDYIDRVYRPDGRFFNGFWDGSGEGPEWWGPGTLSWPEDFDLDREVPETDWQESEGWWSNSRSLTMPDGSRFERTAAGLKQVSS